MLVAKAVGTHAAILGLSLQEVTTRGEVWLRALPEADFRLEKVVQEASLQQEVPMRLRKYSDVFRAADEVWPACLQGGGPCGVSGAGCSVEKRHRRVETGGC